MLTARSQVAPYEFFCAHVGTGAGHSASPSEVEAPILTRRNRGWPTAEALVPFRPRPACASWRPAGERGGWEAACWSSSPPRAISGVLGGPSGRPAGIRNKEAGTVSLSAFQGITPARPGQEQPIIFGPVRRLPPTTPLHPRLRAFSAILRHGLQRLAKRPDSHKLLAVHDL